MQIGVHKVAMNAPSDVAELDRLIQAGIVDPARIVALIGKTEGNGGANDFTRGFATLSYQLLLAKHLGIAPEEVEGIFEIFASTKGTRGTGLGLPVSRKIAREHGGDITVESAPGRGAKFIIELPMRPRDARSPGDEFATNA